MGRCGEGYEKICIAHDVCRLRIPLKRAGRGISKRMRAEIIREWLNAGLIRRDGEDYDVTELCRRYEEYVECVKRGGRPIWSCFKSTLGRGRE